MKFIVAVIILFGACVYANPQSNRDRNEWDRNGNRTNKNDGGNSRDRNVDRNHGDDRDNDHGREGNNRGNNNRVRNDWNRDHNKNNRNDPDNDRDRQGNNRVINNRVRNNWGSNVNRNNGNNWDNDRGRQVINRGQSGGVSQWRNRIFFEGRGEVYAKCETTQKNWYRITHKDPLVTYVKDIATRVGYVSSLEECITACELMPTCYYAVRTSKGTCFLLNTEYTEDARTQPRSDRCKHWTNPSAYGKILLTEQCSIRDPCPAAYRVCNVEMPDGRTKPCTLVTIMDVYCHTKSEDRAVQECKPGI